MSSRNDVAVEELRPFPAPSGGRRGDRSLAGEGFRGPLRFGGVEYARTAHPEGPCHAVEFAVPAVGVLNVLPVGAGGHDMVAHISTVWSA